MRPSSARPRMTCSTSPTSSGSSARSVRRTAWPRFHAQARGRWRRAAAGRRTGRRDRRPPFRPGRPAPEASRRAAMASSLGTSSTWTGTSIRFSRTVMWVQRLKLWNTMPSDWRDAFHLAAVGGRAVGAHRHLLAADHDPARRGRFQKVDAAQHRGLARPRPADDGHHVAFAGPQRHALQHLDRAEGFSEPLDPDGFRARGFRALSLCACILDRLFDHCSKADSLQLCKRIIRMGHDRRSAKIPARRRRAAARGADRCGPRSGRRGWREAATVRAIAERAGVTPGLIRHYFQPRKTSPARPMPSLMTRMLDDDAVGPVLRARRPAARLAAFVAAGLRPPVVDAERSACGPVSCTGPHRPRDARGSRDRPISAIATGWRR